MAGMRDLKRRIRSIQSTRKITRAMQLVSAAKMRKAQNATLASRTYSTLAWELILNLTNSPEKSSPLLKSYPRATKTGIVLISTNRGQVGSLNVNLVSQLKKITDTAEVMMEVINHGKKGRVLAAKLGLQFKADFPKLDKTHDIQDIFPIAQLITDAYKTGEYKKIYLVYNHFVSTLVQKPVIKQLLPFPETFTNLSRKEADEEPTEIEDNKYTPSQDYLFEPTPKLVLQHLLPRIIESQIYQAVLESDASEHSARMVMMKNATEAAGDLIDDFTLTYNQMRQNKITTELSEITAGRIALE